MTLDLPGREIFRENDERKVVRWLARELDVTPSSLSARVHNMSNDQLRSMLREIRQKTRYRALPATRRAWLTLTGKAPK